MKRPKSKCLALQIAHEMLECELFHSALGNVLVFTQRVNTAQTNQIQLEFESKAERRWESQHSERHHDLRALESR
jgi:hypothetical protein